MFTASTLKGTANVRDRRDTDYDGEIEGSDGLGNNRAPIDPLGIGPQSFEVVQFARLGQERMQDDIAPVLENPRTLFVSLGRRGLVTARLHLHADFIAERMHLADIRARGDHEKIHDRCHTGQIEYHRVFTAVLFTQLGDETGVFQAALQPGILRAGNNGGNGETPSDKRKISGGERSNREREPRGETVPPTNSDGWG